MPILFSSLHLENLFQKLGFSIGSVYLTFLILSLFFFSPSKVNIPSTFSDKLSNEVAPKSAGAIFRDFDRTEFKDRKAKWNIKAVKAEYFSNNGLINLSEPNVIVFGEAKEKPTLIKAKTSRLTVLDGEVQNAFLEGDVEIKSGAGAVIKTATSEYVERESRLTSPDHVYITGPGYEIEGDSSDVNTLTDDIFIRGNIKSKFESSARMPLNFKSEKK